MTATRNTNSLDELAARLRDAYQDFALRFCVRRSLDKSCCEVVEQADGEVVTEPVNLWRFDTWKEAESFHDGMMWRHIAKAAEGGQ